MLWTSILTLLTAPAARRASVLALGLWVALPSPAQSRAEDALQDMQQAFRRMDRARLTQALPQVRGHVLEPLAAYWELRARLDTASEGEIQGFLQRHAGSYYEDRLRNDWLLQQGRRRDWSTVAAEYPRYRMRDDRELACYALAADAILQRRDVTAEAVRLWHSQREADDGCTWLIDHLHTSRKIEPLVLWKKARLAVEANRPAAARAAVDIETPKLSAQVAPIMESPQRYLDKRIGAITRNQRELATLALVRLATQDPQAAASLLDKRWQVSLNAEERNWVWGVIGKQAAQKLMPEADDYFAKVGKPSDLNDDLLGWMVRAALRAGRWALVSRAYEAMSEGARRDPTWAYWQGRALVATANTLPLAQAETQRQQAQALWREIASMRGFYEQLAMEELGLPLAVPERPTAPTAEERAAALANPGLQRALAAIAIGLRPEGVREWNYSTNLHTPGGMNDRELLAAAELACQREVFDRCINTSERTRGVIDLAQRFPMPMREIVVRRANAIGLDPAYVYGLIRQESRFIMDARSHVGASGLMQVMPATARWTAKKIGLTQFQPHQITDKEINVQIGTGYLKMVLDDFEGSMAMATAAYNAGPSRPRAWRNGPVLDGAIWAENIPFSETRDYVKKVLANTTSYAALITGTPQSLKARLGRVGPRAAGTSAPNEELP